VVLAASDAMGAAQGVRSLTEHGFDVVAVSGTLTRSPLAVREAQEELGLPTLGIPELQDPQVVAPLLGIDPSLVGEPEPIAAPAWPIDLPGLEEAAVARDREAGLAHAAQVRVDDLEFVSSHELSRTRRQPSLVTP
jgi:hypothetical protein